MTDEKLESFKASDLQRPGVKRGAAARATSERQAASAGFPNIEAILEAEELDLSGLDARLEALRELAQKGSAKEKGAARKAIAAYERTRDLLEFLWQTKQTIAEQTGAQGR